MGQRDLTGATKLQTARVAWNRERARPHLDAPATDLDYEARHYIRSLSVSEQDLGQLHKEQGDPTAALPRHQAGYNLMERIGDTAGQAVAAAGLGNTYLLLKDLDQAQHWHQRSLELRPADNRIGRAVSHGSLANVAYDRFEAARDAGAPEAEQLAHLNASLAGHQQALDLLPPDHHQHRATAHSRLAAIYHQVGEAGLALRNFQQAIHHEEARGDAYGAAEDRYNIALLLYSAGRPDDALHYAHAAHTTQLALGPDTAADARRTATLIQFLQQAIDTQ
jgi:tetratricopeptide (TPR) repeat protein